MRLNNLPEILQTIEKNKDKLAALVVHLNDTYILEERVEQNIPGFPRLIATVDALRQQVIDKTGLDRTIVVHSGDFLGPSLIGRHTDGRAMVEVLNRLGLNWCTLGNHELDYSEEKLLARLKEAKFGVTQANAKLPPQVENKSIVLWPSSEDPVIAFTGIASESVGKSFPEGWQLSSSKEAMMKFGRAARNVPFRIALTHATMQEDKELSAIVEGRTIILGGHDHDIEFIDIGGPAPIMKNLSNLQTVRILLLYSGNAGAYLALRAAYNQEKRAFISEMPREEREDLNDWDERKLLSFADYKDKLLEAISPSDAQVFSSFWKKQEERGVLSPLMLDAIESLPNYGDLDWALLSSRDHLEPKSSDLEMVEKYLRLVPVADKVIKDWSEQFPKGIDTKDSSMRHAPNSFGQYTALCVQKYASVLVGGPIDLALVHAGQFRADADLPGKVTLQVLQECFLYDSETAMIVLRLPADIVRALIDGGRGRVGEGGYPQLSNSVDGMSGELRVAISSYVLEHPKAIDKYDEVLMRKLGLADLEATRRWVGERVEARFSIIRAIEEFGAVTELEKLSQRQDLSKAVNMFVFYAELLYKIDSDLKENDPRLKSDLNLSDRRLKIARDNIRRWLRSLESLSLNNLPPPLYPELQVWDGDDYTLPVKSLMEAEADFSWTPDSYKQLRLLYNELEQSPMRFRTGRKYHKLMEQIATGIGGWLGP